MRIVNPRRFTIACIVFIMILGLMGYGIYRGGVWVFEKVMASTKQEAIPSTLVMEVKESEPTVEVSDSFEVDILEDLKWVSRFVVGCEAEVFYKEGIASLTFKVIPELALNYYPRQELRTRMLKQSLKLIQDVSVLSIVEKLERLDLLYVDSRLEMNDNPVGKALELRLNRNQLQQVNWEEKNWSMLEAYMVQ